MATDDRRMLILDCLRKVAPEVESDRLDPQRTFNDQLDFDSVDFLNFIMTIEQRLGVRIAEADYPKLSTLDGCMAYLTAAVPPSEASS